jgi:hypothetical protein
MNKVTNQEQQILKKFYTEYWITADSKTYNHSSDRYNTAATAMNSLNLTLADSQKSRNWSVKEVQQMMKKL